MTEDIEYPMTPEGWRDWLEIHLEISEEQGHEIAKNGTFPFESLIAVWEKEFSVEHGYSSSFIPALTRNKLGFINWVYLDQNEPDWSKSDSDRTS